VQKFHFTNSKLKEKHFYNKKLLGNYKISKFRKSKAPFSPSDTMTKSIRIVTAVIATFSHFESLSTRDFIGRFSSCGNQKTRNSFFTMVPMDSWISTSTKHRHDNVALSISASKCQIYCYQNKDKLLLYWTNTATKFLTGPHVAHGPRV